MKKILTFTLSGIVALGLAGSMFAGCTVEEPINLYLAPGVYFEDGERVENSIAQTEGVTALTKEQCERVNTENAYICTLEEGEALPVPASTRTDKEGNPYTFNGWWTIVNATVTYYDTVPALRQTTFLYADWRADLSQRLDPVVPDESTVTTPNYYMSIYRAETQEIETVTLLVSGTDVAEAETLGYSAPVQLYNEWFELNPGDEISVYTAGLGATGEVQLAPVAVSGKALTITLEKSGTENNDTNDYLEKQTGGTTLTYKTGLASRHFRIYIKFYDSGATMTVYMQPME